jgi:UDP-N-acetylglucosamine acyltransferase
LIFAENEIMDLYDPFSMYDPSNQIHPTAIIYPNVRMGKNNKIGPYTVIGSPGEIRGTKDADFKGWVDIGDNNMISEMVTIQSPLEDKKVTYLGSNNIIMAHSHIGHDACIGDDCEISTGSIIGGYAVINDNVKIKLAVTVRNRIIIDENATVGMGSVVVKNVPPHTTVFGVPAKPR